MADPMGAILTDVIWGISDLARAHGHSLMPFMWHGMAKTGYKDIDVAIYRSNCIHCGIEVQMGVTNNMVAAIYEHSNERIRLKCKGK